MPIYQARSEEIGDSLIDNVISKFGIPEYLIMDQDSSFMSTIMNYLFRKLNIKIKTVAPFNHKSLQAEHGIKSLSTILTKHLTEQGQMWPKDLVYIISPLTSQLRTNSRKVTIKYVGPLVIYKIVDPHNYLLMTLDGKKLRGLFEFERIKPAMLRTSHGNINTLAQLKQILSLGIIL